MLRIGWFSTGRGEGSQHMLRAVVEAVHEGRLDARIAFVFSNRERGQFAPTDAFFDQIATYGIPLITLSDTRFRRAHGGEVARSGQSLPAWRTEYDRAAEDLLQPYSYDLGVLHGYMLVMTEPLFRGRVMLNLHPAAPGQPAGTWQDVIWQLIEQRVDHGGVRIHLVSPELDQGAIVTYCTFALRGPTIDLLWRAAEHRSVAEIRESEGEAFPLFQEIRRRGYARELPLVIETLRALADGRLRIDDGVITAGTTRITQGFDLTPEVEGSLAKTALA